MIVTTSKKSGSPAPPRVLLSHRYLWPENLSLYPAILKDIAEWHVAQGAELTIVTSRACCAKEQSRRDEWTRRQRIQMVELPLAVDRGRPVLERLMNSIRYAAHLLLTLIRGRFDLVSVASYPPVLPATVARLVARWKGYAFLYCVQDIFPEMLLTSPSRLARLAGRFLQIIDTANMRSAAAIVTVSDDMKQTLVHRGVNAHKVFVVPNYPVDCGVPSRRGSAKRPAQLVYAGNHGKVQNLRFMLLAAERAATRCRFQLKLIGDGSELEGLKRFVDESGVHHVEFSGALPRDEAQRRIAEADAGIIAARPDLYKIAYPSKLMSYLVAGLPVLVFAEADSSIARFVKEHDLGIAASPTNVDDAADAIVALVERIAAYDAVRVARVAARIFSKQAYFSAYNRVVARCLPEERSYHDLYARSA